MQTSNVNTLFIDGLTRMERASYFEKFGQLGFLNIENQALIEIERENKYTISKLNTFFNIFAENFDYLIVDLDAANS